MGIFDKLNMFNKNKTVPPDFSSQSDNENQIGQDPFDQNPFEQDQNQGFDQFNQQQQFQQPQMQQQDPFTQQDQGQFNQQDPFGQNPFEQDQNQGFDQFNQQQQFQQQQDPFTQQDQGQFNQQNQSQLNTFDASRPRDVPLYAQHSRDNYPQQMPQQQTNQMQKNDDPWAYNNQDNPSQQHTNNQDDALLNTKLDTIKTMLDNMSHRLTSIEQQLGKDSRRW